MFKKSVTISFLLLAILMAYISNAQPNKNADNYSLVNWNTDQGFPSKYTNCILKDVYGFLWIGTKTGLSRFDGSTFKNYFPGVGNAETIPGANIIGLKEDSLHNIWIGTDNGISRYDIQADTFTVFLPAGNTLNSNTSIIPFWATKNEVLCMEADSIFTAYNIQSFKKRIIIKLPQRIGDNRMVPFSVFDARTNSVWMQPASGYLSAASGLFRISLQTGEKKNYDWTCFKNIPDHFHWTEGMCYDKNRNCIWLNNVDGVIRFTLADEQFHYIQAVKNLHNRGVGICIDKNGKIWVGTANKGIFIYDPETNSATVPFANDSTFRDSANFSNYRIYCDRDGITWVGYWTQFGKGINQLIPTSGTTQRYKLNGDHRGTSILKGSDKQFFIVGSYGIDVFDIKTGLTKQIEREQLKGIEKNKEVEFLAIDSTFQKAWIFVFPAGGLYTVDLPSLKCYPLTTKDLTGRIHSLDNTTDIITTRIYKKGYLFIGSTDGNEGSSVFAVNKDSFSARELISFGNTNVNDIATDGDSTIFLRVEDSKVNLSYRLIQGRYVQIHTPIDSIPWIGIYYNKADETWWVSGAYLQLLHFDKNFHLLHNYTQSDGISDIQIHSVITDNKGNVWFNGSSSYISQLDVKTGIITRLSAKDGYIKQPNYPVYGCLKDDYGSLYFLGYNGMDKINPNLYKFLPTNAYIKSIDIKQFRIPTATGVNDIKKLSLKYFQNTINIETGAIDFYSQGKGAIRYRLLSKSRKEIWRYAPANYSIHYEELPPGKYTLQMQAGNAGNEFTGPIKNLLLGISPPFWATWWFRIVAVIFVAVIVFAFVQHRSRNLRRRNVILEDKVMHRTKELKHSLEELRSTQAQLIQSEKMASLGELTSGIAHEIKNPLNFIKNFSEINIELIAEVEEEQLPNLDTNTQAELTPLIKTLKKNAEKINHHGSRIDGIVSSMLQHSRLGSNQKELIDINALCDESLKLAYNGFRAKEKAFSATFETHFQHDLPKLLVVPQEIGRVLINLINNAFYTVNEKKKGNHLNSSPDGLQANYKPCIIVSTKKNEDKIIIRVSDNGMGISAQIINKIYQPFFTTKPTGEGTGLGLSMSYDIITKGHDGELNVKSEEGKGTDFEIVLPAS